jgi:hypothetical protein
MKAIKKIMFYHLATIGVFLILMNSCKKDEEKPVFQDKLAASELQAIEAAGVDTISSYDNALFPDSTNIYEWSLINDPGYNFSFTKSSLAVSAFDKKRLFIERMTHAGFLLTFDNLYSFPNQTSGLGYVYNSKNILAPSVYSGATCQEPLYGLDCSGMIYQMALASNINLVSQGTVNYVNINTWNTAFNNSPDFQGLEMKDLLALAPSQLQAGDIIVASGKHIGMVFDNGVNQGIFNSLGSVEYSCSINSNNTHGPIITNNIGSWLTQVFGTDYHVLRVKAIGNTIDNSTWDVICIHSETVQWHADVTFYENGTTKYDEPSEPGIYLSFGVWSMNGNQVHWSMGLDPNYIFDGTVTGDTMSGTYVLGNETKTWTATKR